MLINVLVCHSDGTQTLETREVPDDYFAVEEVTADEQFQQDGQPTA